MAKPKSWGEMRETKALVRSLQRVFRAELTFQFAPINSGARGAYRFALREIRRLALPRSTGKKGAR